MKIINAIATATAVLVLLAIPAGAAAAESALTLNVREQREVEVPPNPQRITVADPEVADVLILRGSGKRKSSALIVGKKPGATVVSIQPRDGPTAVWKVNVLGAMQNLPSTSGAGADLQVNSGSAVISGQAPSLLSHANTVAAGVDAVGQGKLLDASTIATGGAVQIDVKIVEFSKSVLKEAGFDFAFNLQRNNFGFGLINNMSASVPLKTPASAAFQLLASVTRGTSTLTTSLQLIESNGLARVLAQPSLTALSGQSASFLAGGELPIPQSGGLGTTTIVYKPFGIGLTVTPTVLAADRIALKVAPEASDIDFTNAVVANNISIPAITTRRAETTLELGDGESFVIGGLVSRTTKSNLSKVPFLGDLPIIGAFFRSMRYTQDEKELVIIVTPHLIRPLAKGVAPVLPGAQEKRDSPANAWSAYVLGIAGRDDLPGFSK
jgi:pilus assembly protein CpaC